MTARSSKIFVFAVASSLALWTAYLVVRYDVTIPFQDDWSFVGRYLAVRNGTLTLSDLTAQHNEHRIFVPLAIMSLNAAILGWSIKVNLIFAILLESATAGMLIHLVYRTSPGKDSQLLCGLLVAIQVFNMAQFVNWLWEWALGWHILNFCTAGMFLLLSIADDGRKQKACVIGAAMLALTASFSIASGMVLWPLGLCYLVASPKFGRRFSLFWVGAAAVAVGLFLIGYHGSQMTGTAMPIFDRIAVTMEFLFRFLGSTLSAGSVAGFFALIGALAAAFVCLLHRDRAAFPWIGIAAIPGATALPAAITRAPWLGALEGSATRYSTVSLMFVIATGVLTVLALEKRGALLRSAIPATLLALSIIHYPTGYSWFFWLVDRLERDQYCLYHDMSNTPCLEDMLVAGAADVVRSKWHLLEADGWAERMRPAN